MGCFIIPSTAAIVHYFMRKKIPSIDTKHHLWLNQLFLGGAIFGIVDHWWNRELFLFGNNLIPDLALGVMITMVIFAVWKVIVLQDSRNPSKATSRY